MPEIGNRSVTTVVYRTWRQHRKAVFWHYPHNHGSGSVPSGAVRAGDYKLIQWYGDRSVELYNLDDDLSERHDLAPTMPTKAAELLKMLDDWRQSVDAEE